MYNVGSHISKGSAVKEREELLVYTSEYVAGFRGIHFKLNKGTGMYLNEWNITALKAIEQCCIF